MARIGGGQYSRETLHVARKSSGTSAEGKVEGGLENKKSKMEKIVILLIPSHT